MPKAKAGADTVPAAESYHVEWATISGEGVRYVLTNTRQVGQRGYDAHYWKDAWTITVYTKQPNEPWRFGGVTAKFSRNQREAAVSRFEREQRNPGLQFRLSGFSWVNAPALDVERIRNRQEIEGAWRARDWGYEAEGSRPGLEVAHEEANREQGRRDQAEREAAAVGLFRTLGLDYTQAVGLVRCAQLVGWSSFFRDPNLPEPLTVSSLLRDMVEGREHAEAV